MGATRKRAGHGVLGSTGKRVGGMSEPEIEAGESVEVTELVDDQGEIVGAVVDDLVVVTDGDTTVIDETVDLIDTDGVVVAEDETVTVYDADGGVLSESESTTVLGDDQA